MKRNPHVAILTGNPRGESEYSRLAGLTAFALMIVVGVMTPLHADDLIIGSEQSVGFTGQARGFHDSVGRSTKLGSV